MDNLTKWTMQLLTGPKLFFTFAFLRYFDNYKNKYSKMLQHNNVKYKYSDMGTSDYIYVNEMMLKV